MKHLFLIFFLLINHIGHGQFISVMKYEGFDCRKDSTWSGGCENKYMYTFQLNSEKQTIKQTQYQEIKVRGDWNENGFNVIDSTNELKKTHPLKGQQLKIFEKMTEHILSNENNKLIGINPSYFISNATLKKMNTSSVQDSIQRIKVLLEEKMTEFKVSSVMKQWRISFEYKNEQYLFVKSSENIFWSVYHSTSDKLLFRFFYPDWNIYVNNLIRTKRKIANDLQIIEMHNNITFNLGRKIVTPVVRFRS